MNSIIIDMNPLVYIYTATPLLNHVHTKKSEARHIFKSLNCWIIRRLRCILLKQWKNPRTKIRNLLKRGISHRHAVLCGNARKKHWRMSRVKWVIVALPNKYFLDLGLFLPGGYSA